MLIFPKILKVNSNIHLNDKLYVEADKIEEYL